ncbi:MAG: hypothetical protein WA817_02245 [Candidatus Acidiferrum sp.]
MRRLHMFSSLNLLGFIATVGLLALAPSAHAQAQEVQIPGTDTTFPVCKPADLDTNVSFFHAPKNYFTVAFDMQNISESACVPDPQIGMPMFEVQPGKEIKPFALCSDCEDRLPNGEYRVYSPVVLNPAEVAHQTFRWKTAAPSEAVTCLKLSALFGPVLVVAPPLFPQVCSEIEVSRTHAGPFAPPSAKGEPQTEEVQSGEVFVLSSSKPRYYQDEGFTLHVGLASPGAGAPSGEDCPTLFLRVKSPDGATRFDAARPSGFKTCKSFTWGADRDRDWQSGFEVDSGVRSRWAGIGEHSFDLLEPVGSSSDGRIQFARSNKLTLQIDDPALIARKWGPKVKGVAVDVTLDKDTYQPGEDVPLHIAVENFDAPVPIYATNPVGDPYLAIGVAVYDAMGRLLPENERSPAAAFWTGHGWPPILFPPGKLVPMERSLAAQGWLPAHPGTYLVVVTWCPIDGTNYKPGPEISLGSDGRTYATVQAAVAFRVLGEETPAAQSHQ